MNVYGTAQFGSFSPVAQGATTAGTGTYTTQLGRFVKRDGAVQISLRVQWTALAGPPAGRLQIRCPGVPAPTFETPLSFSLQSGAIDTTRTEAVISSDGANTLIDFFDVDATGARSNVDSADASYTGGATISCSGTFFTTE